MERDQPRLVPKLVLHCVLMGRRFYINICTKEKSNINSDPKERRTGVSAQTNPLFNRPRANFLAKDARNGAPASRMARGRMLVGEAGWFHRLEARAGRDSW